LSPRENNISIHEMKNFTCWKGELAAIGIHRSLTLSIELAFSNTWIINRLDKDKRQVESMIMHVNYNPISCSMSCLQLNLNPDVHATMSNKQCKITYSCYV
jgi:hypothetical protein